MLTLEEVSHWIHVHYSLVVGVAEFSVSFAHLAVAVVPVLVACGGVDVCGEPVGVAPLDPPTDVAGHSAGAVVSGHSAEAVACVHSAGAVAASGGGSGADGHGLAAQAFDQVF